MSRQCLFLSGRKKSADVVEQLSCILMRYKDARAAVINHAVSLNQKPGPSAAAGRCRTFHSPAPFSPEVRSAAGAPGYVAVALQLAGQGGRPRLEAAGHQEGGDALQAFPAPPTRRSAARACPACGTEQHSTCTVVQTVLGGQSLGEKLSVRVVINLCSKWRRSVSSDRETRPLHAARTTCPVGTATNQVNFLAVSSSDARITWHALSS